MQREKDVNLSFGYTVVGVHLLELCGGGLLR